MFRLTRTSVIAIAALLITAGSAGITSKDLPLSKPEDVGLSSERLARMNKAIHEYVDAGRTPGVVTLIARHGKVVHVDAYGKADLATGRPTRSRRHLPHVFDDEADYVGGAVDALRGRQVPAHRSAVALLPGVSPT